MHVSYLVDGYNLLFALGLLDQRAGTRALEQARHRLLEYVHDSFGEANHDITVIFDSTRQPRGSAAAQEYRGIRIQFATDHKFADDIIEELIAACAVPRGLVVISNDHRIQEAARRKGACIWTSGDFLDHRDREPRADRAESRERELPGPLSGEEVSRWMAEFGELTDDPELRAMLKRFQFEEDMKGAD